MLAPVLTLSSALYGLVLAQVLALTLSLALSGLVVSLLLSFGRCSWGFLSFRVASSPRLASLLALALVLALFVALPRPVVSLALALLLALSRPVAFLVLALSLVLSVSVVHPLTLWEVTLRPHLNISFKALTFGCSDDGPSCLVGILWVALQSSARYVQDS